MKANYTLGPAKQVANLHNLVKDDPFTWRKVANIMRKFWTIRSPLFPERFNDEGIAEVCQSIRDTKLPIEVRLEVYDTIMNIILEDMEYIKEISNRVGEYPIKINPWM